MDFKNMLGKKIESVVLSKDKETIVFSFQDGSRRAFGVEGECCSTSWIEHLEMPDKIRGSVILDVKEGDGVPWDNHECKRKKGSTYGNECGHDSLSVYNTTFKTDKGEIVLEYRNDSNGYYGGNLYEAN